MSEEFIGLSTNGDPVYGNNEIPSTKIFFREDIELDTPWNVRMFRAIANELSELYERKNADYGDSFSKGIDRFGFQSALGIIYNKFCRCENLLLKSDIQVKDESIQDTLRDISVYCIQLAMYLDKKDTQNDD